MTERGIIQRGDILARLAKALGVKDRSPSPTLDSRVQPVFIVGDAREEPIGAFERPFFGYEVVTAAAGQFPAVQCLNPANSGVDISVDYIILASAATQFVDWRINTTPLATLTTKATQYRDTTPGQPLAQIRQESLAAVILGAAQARYLTSTQIIPVDIRFAAGAALTVCGQAAAVLLSVSFFGREIVKPYRTT